MQLAFTATLVIAMAGGKDATAPYELTTDPRQARSEAAELLVEELADPRKGRSAAARLVRFGRTAVPALRRALSDERLQVRFYAASALALICDPAAVRILLRVLADEKEPPLIRRIAAGAMSRGDCREAIPVLVRLAQRAYSPRGRARESGRRAEKGAAGGAEGHSDRGDDALAGPSGEPFRYEVVKALAYMGPAAADEIITAALADPSARIRKVAAQGLGDHRVASAVGALTKALADPEAEVAREAARALGKFGRMAAPAAEDLVGLLDHEDIRVREASRAALVLATGYSFSTTEKWRQWWRRRQERLAAERAKAERATELRESEKAGESGVFEWPFDEKDEKGATSSSSPPRSGPKTGKTPPALRMPWECEDEDWTETPEP